MKHYSELLPLYAVGQLPPKDIALVAEHLKHCPDCQDELVMWRRVSNEIRSANVAITLPPDLATRALEKIHQQPQQEMKPGLTAQIRAIGLRMVNLLRTQIFLIKSDIWPASAGIMALAILVALISKHIEVISFISPLIAAGGMAMLYGADNDPAHELVMSTPTSTWKILLARLSIVSLFNLLLSLLASLVMLLIVPAELLGAIILGWLAPMAFLSALALLLSLWIGTSNAVAVTYGLWIFQFVLLSKGIQKIWYSTALDALASACRNFWRSPGLLFILAVVLVGIVLVSTRFEEKNLRPVVS